MLVGSGERWRNGKYGFGLVYGKRQRRFICLARRRIVLCREHLGICGRSIVHPALRNPSPAWRPLQTTCETSDPHADGPPSVPA